MSHRTKILLSIFITVFIGSSTYLSYDIGHHRGTSEATDDYLGKLTANNSALGSVADSILEEQERKYRNLLVKAQDDKDLYMLELAESYQKNEELRAELARTPKVVTIIEGCNEPGANSSKGPNGSGASVSNISNLVEDLNNTLEDNSSPSNKEKSGSLSSPSESPIYDKWGADGSKGPNGPGDGRVSNNGSNNNGEGTGPGNSGSDSDSGNNDNNSNDSSSDSGDSNSEGGSKDSKGPNGPNGKSSGSHGKNGGHENGKGKGHGKGRGSHNK
jgi:hypothetical protein